MKRIAALLAALALSVSLAACGTSDTPESGGADTGGPAAEDGALVVGEVYSTDTIDIMVTGFEFSEKAMNPNGDNHFAPSSGYVTANIYYVINYNGKTETTAANFAPYALEYGDGYIFNLEKYWFFSESAGGWLNSGSIAPLSEPFACKACFFVPEEVEQEKGNALSIQFKIADEPLTYSPRPESEQAKEATYLYCQELLQSDKWSDAENGRSLLGELNGYKDSNDLILQSRLKFFTYEDREFFKEHVSDLEPMSGDAIKALLTGATFSMRNNYGGDDNGNHTITFSADGTVNATYTYEGKEYSMYEGWKMDGDQVVCTHSYTNTYGEAKTGTYVFTPYQYDETHYLLIDQTGDYSMLLTVQ